MWSKHCKKDGEMNFFFYQTTSKSQEALKYGQHYFFCPSHIAPISLREGCDVSHHSLPLVNDSVMLLIATALNVPHMLWGGRAGG